MQQENPPFIILALPRSRTTWLSKFLSYGEWECGHDQLRYMRSLDDIKTWLSMPNTGTCETAGAPFWRLLSKYAPHARIVTVRRPVEEVIESLAKVGVTAPEIKKSLTAIDRKLDQIEGRLPNVKSVNFSDLSNEITCGEVFEFCLPYQHDREWWKGLSSLNIQTNFPALMRYVTAHLDQIDRLGAQARLAMFKDLSVKAVNMSAVKIEEESCDAWFKDCQHLFHQHCSDVGEHPDNWINKNWELFKKLHAWGFMQIMIARSNGKPFGYLMTLLSPSLEAPERMISQHTAFYAAKEFPGLGLKIQRAAMANLKEKGIYEIFMRAGIRGDGERMGVLYKRLGAQDFGRMYRVELGA